MAPFKNNSLKDSAPAGESDLDDLDGDTEAEVAQSTSSWMMLQKIARSDDPEVRALVAGNPRTDMATLDRTLAADDDERVRLAVARNPRTSVAGMLTVLGATLPPAEQMSSDADEESQHKVVAALCENTSTPAELLSWIRDSFDLDDQAREAVAASTRSRPHSSHATGELYEFFTLSMDEVRPSGQR